MPLKIFLFLLAGMAHAQVVPIIWAVYGEEHINVETSGVKRLGSFFIENPDSLSFKLSIRFINNCVLRGFNNHAIPLNSSSVELRFAGGANEAAAKSSFENKIDYKEENLDCGSPKSLEFDGNENNIYEAYKMEIWGGTGSYKLAGFFRETAVFTITPLPSPSPKIVPKRR